ncbi:hypothetical protein EVG20_g11081, partial [Dentipellis fragilis]
LPAPCSLLPAPCSLLPAPLFSPDSTPPCLVQLLTTTHHAQVNTAAQAALVASEARFPPAGVRGFGSPFTHGVWGTGMSAAEYLAGANGSVLVLVQIETREAVGNLEAIAAVEGVDVLFIGPFDLSLSLGFPTPSPDPHPEVEKVIQHILQVGHAAKKKVAIFCTSGAQAAIRAKQGFDMVNVTADTNVLTQGMASELAIAAGQAQ